MFAVIFINTPQYLPFERGEFNPLLTKEGLGEVVFRIYNFTKSKYNFYISSYDCLTFLILESFSYLFIISRKSWLVLVPLILSIRNSMLSTGLRE